MIVRRVHFVTAMLLVAVGFWSLHPASGAALPENLAYRAKVSASSEYNGNHLAKFAVDGKIPGADCKNDVQAAWCVRKEAVGDQGDFVFEWGEPVEVTEIVYFARMAMLRTECWKDYEVYLDDASRRRILAWIDLDIPYYGNTETAYPEAQSCRKVYPDQLDAVLAEVAARRCAACHTEGKIPRRPWTRITEPETNSFLMAPLAKAAGGRQSCGEPVFHDKDDPDYRAILATFQPVLEQLTHTPRTDMPGGKPSPTLCRICQ